jgi:amino acid transporter
MTTVEKDPRPRVKRLVVGAPKPTRQFDETLLPKRLALPIFASDALSSVAYATEAALVVLLAASASGRSELLPVSFAIAALLAVVIASYQQTVRVYESSGGAYVVAKDNLGTLPSLVGAAALLTDYVLTVAVSIAAGVVALVSAVPALSTHRVALSLVFIALITIGNLRGVRESGLVFALPTYAFIVSMLALVVGGAARCADGTCGPATAPQPMTVGAGAIGLFVLLRAFASGSTALTGVEAIANGVSAFRQPQARNAARTLGVLGALAITFFLGVSYLATEMHATPNVGGYPSVLSQIARIVFPGDSPTSFMYYAVQASTVAILLLAANTAYQGFPRLAALLAHDRFFPRQFTNLGDRLVYSNGILVLAGVASALVCIYAADVDALIHLYVIGVFTAFTLSQTGMVRYWLRTHDPGWRWRALTNGTGALATFLVTLVVIWTKFAAGAWMVIVAIPLLVLAFLGIHRHYRRIARRLRAGTAAVRSAGTPSNQVLIVPDRVDIATESALWYAHRIGRGEERAVHAPGRGSDVAIRPRWYRLAAHDPELEILDPSEGRIDAVLEELWKLPRGERDVVTVVIPEQFRRPSLLTASRRTAFRLKLRLLSEPGVVVADVPVISDRRRPQGHTATTLIARILVADVNAASMRALNYAQSLDADDLRAVFFATAADEARELGEAWAHADTAVPLDVLEAPYRDIGDPLLAYIRELTGRPDVAVNVVMPELVLHGWARFLHNQRALYIKRLLLFEPGVILTSVPYQLFR